MRNPDAPTASPSPICPLCGDPLRLSGTVVNTGRYKKWLEHWTCPNHGTVELCDNPDADQRAANRVQPRKSDVPV